MDMKNEDFVIETAEEICKNSPVVQNEIMKQVYNIVKNRRYILVEEAIERANFLKETCDALSRINM